MEVGYDCHSLRNLEGLIMPVTYVPIQSVSLTSNQTVVTFANIPQTFTDLVVRATARYAATNTFTVTRLFVNGVTTNQSQRNLFGPGDTNTASSASGNWSANTYVAVPSDYTPNTFGSAEWYIPNYAGSANKASSLFGVVENNSATAWIGANALLWSSTNAITSVSFEGIGGSFAAGSAFHLYGIKNT